MRSEFAAIPSAAAVGKLRPHAEHQGTLDDLADGTPCEREALRVGLPA